ncbi:universal stress protein [Caldalkalibacillus salinus]|uniref:universal stress protein n=1 Tax=Caldalkalibacillus salinus TaxID=2803787 RepID=UPI001922DD8B|nr:universal stress protein [Caldalkalibacillus salinus]
MFKRILLASDGSNHSFRAAEKAVTLAKGNEEAHVEVIYVIDHAISKTDALQNLDATALKQKRIERLASIEALLKKEGVPYDVKLIRGEPGPTIVKYANDQEVDLVIIGSRGLNHFQEMVLGSVSHKVAKRASCPVMIVK